MKTLKLDLDYLARTYGIDLLSDARISLAEDGSWSLVLEGETKRGDR